MKKILLTLLGVLIALPALARDFTYTYEGQTLTYTVISESAKTCRTKSGESGWSSSSPGNSVSGELIIPSVVNDGDIEYSVTEIGEYAFYRCSGLTQVTIPNSVNSIGKWAFYNCSGLTQVTIPNSVTNSGSGAFENCSGLTKAEFASIEALCAIEFGDERANPLYYANHLYIGSEEVTEVVIPESVTAINNYAFFNCYDLTSVTIPNSVTSIGEGAFNGCWYLTKAEFSSIEALCAIKFGTVSANPLYYAKHLYIGDEEVTEVVIPESVTAINYTFAGGSYLKSVIIPNSVTSISSGAFENCSRLTQVTIPNSVKSIGEYAFWNCKGLTQVTIHNSVTSIGSSAFRDCSGLTQVTIPNSVTSIGQNAFSGCSGLTDITVEASSPASIYENTFAGLYDTATLTIPEGSFDAYASSPTWDQFKKIKFANTSEICDYKTFDDGVLTYRLNTIDKTAVVTGANTSAITIPERFTDYSDPANPVRYYVTGIGYGAFKGKTIESFAFNSRSKLEYIGESAFAESTLPAISLPETVKIIGASAFERCSKLTSMTIPNAVTLIGSSAFKDCSRLTSMTIPNAVTAIGQSAFEGCKGLTKAEFASIEALCAIEFGNETANPLYYAKHLYIGGKEVTEVVIPESVTAINGTFAGGSYLKTVTIPESVKIIGGSAFSGCSGLTQMTIPNSVTAIGSSAFSGCSGMTQVTIPNSVKAIGDDAFYNCSGLTQMTIPNSVKAIGDYAFRYCSGLTQVTIGNSVKAIGRSAFLNCTGLTQVTIPNSVKAIGDYAFRDCSGLTQVTIGNSVESIGEYAFYCCSGLTQVTIGNSVRTIGKEAFNLCKGLTSITMVDGTEPIDIASDALPDIKPTSLYWGRPCESLKNIDCSKVTKLTIGNSVMEIPAGKFQNLSYLNKLTLGGGLTAIGDNAFSGCTRLTEVIVPPAVESIGASAFAGDSKLASIIMGSNVRTIGEKAFDGCPASTVSITAKTPPTAPNNTFSNYSGKLYCVDQAAADAYYDAYTCWDRFDSYVMVTPARLEGEQTEIKGKAGEQIQLTATLWPENVTLPQIFWRSTNPEVATVDENGLVTLHVDINRSRGISDGCKIIAESLYGSQLEFNVLDPQSGILEVTIDGGNAAGAVDYAAPYEIYNLGGAYLGSDLDNLAPGLYIIRQGNAVEKRIVR